MPPSTSHSGFPRLFIAGVLLALLGCALLISSIRSFQDKRLTALTIGSQLPSLTSQLSVLKAGLMLTQAYGTDAFVRYEEQAGAYVLPETVDRARVVRVLTETVSALSSQGESVQIDDMTFEDTHPLVLHLRLSGDAAGIAHLLALLDLSGRITLSDVLGKQKTDQFLKIISQTQPVAMPAATLFLTFDPLQYALDPASAEDKMLADFTPVQAADIHAQLLDSPLGQLRSQLTPLAAILKAKRVWPLPLLSVSHIEHTNDSWAVDMQLFER